MQPVVYDEITLEAIIMNTPSARVKQFGQMETMMPFEKETATIVNVECKSSDTSSEENVKVNGAFDVQSAAYSKIPTSKLFSLGERTIIGE